MNGNQASLPKGNVKFWNVPFWEERGEGKIAFKAPFQHFWHFLLLL